MGWSRKAPAGFVGLAERAGLRRGRCKYVPVSSGAASMRLTPLRSPTRPAHDTLRRSARHGKKKEDQKQKRKQSFGPLPCFEI